MNSDTLSSPISDFRIQSAKQAFARFEGHNDPKKLRPTSQFLSGGIGGMVAQYATLCSGLRFK